MQHTRKRAGLLKSALLGAATLGALSLAGAGVARADLVSIGLQQTGYGSPAGSITNADTLGGSTNPYLSTPTVTVVNSFTSASGYASYNGSYGTSSLTIDNAQGTPPSDEPHITGTVSAAFHSAGSLSVYLSETGLTSAIAPAKINSALSLSNLAAGVSITESTYIDPGNGKFALTDLLATKSFGGSSSTGRTNAATVPNLPNTYYSLTELFTFTATGTGTFNSSGGTITTSRVPEPGSLALLGTGLVGLGLVARRRRRKV